MTWAGTDGGTVLLCMAFAAIVAWLLSDRDCPHREGDWVETQRLHGTMGGRPMDLVRSTCLRCGALRSEVLEPREPE